MRDEASPLEIHGCLGIGAVLGLDEEGAELPEPEMTLSLSVPHNCSQSPSVGLREVELGRWLSPNRWAGRTNDPGGSSSGMACLVWCGSM